MRLQPGTKESCKTKAAGGLLLLFAWRNGGLGSAAFGPLGKLPGQKSAEGDADGKGNHPEEGSARGGAPACVDSAPGQAAIGAGNRGAHSPTEQDSQNRKQSAKQRTFFHCIYTSESLIFSFWNRAYRPEAGRLSHCHRRPRRRQPPPGLWG